MDTQLYYLQKQNSNKQSKRLTKAIVYLSSEAPDELEIARRGLRQLIETTYYSVQYSNIRMCVFVDK